MTIPVSVFNTEPVSIGQGNTFKLPTDVGVVDGQAAIYVRNSSVSVASENETIDFKHGIFVHNDSGDFRYLSCSSTKISGAQRGIDIRSDNLAGGEDNEGVSLYVRSCVFEDNNIDIAADATAGNSFLLKGNTFSNQGDARYSIAIGGTLPRRVRIEDNTIDRQTGSGLLLTLPMWDAGKYSLIIEDNSIDVDNTGVSLSLLGGGFVRGNIIDSEGSKALELNNCDGVYIQNNDASATGSSGQFGASIYVDNSVNCILECNRTEGMGSGGGITFFENCDNSVILRNRMSNHVRGLTSFAFNGDPVIGQQPYRDNRWLGGSFAEAALETFNGAIDPQFYIFNQFKVQNNTYSIWPSPIVPSQDPLGGNPMEWFWHDPSPSNPPQVCPESPDDDRTEAEVFNGLTTFEEGLIDGVISPPAGSSGKYRDIDFLIFSKMEDDPSLLTINNQAYYNALNSTYFNNRYNFQNKLIDASYASTSLNIEQDIQTLLNDLDTLSSIDDGTQELLRNSILQNIKSTAATISASVLPYRSDMSNRINNILSLVQNMSGSSHADSALVEVATVYFSNFGTPFEGYTQADQAVIHYYAGLCALEYGKAVYLANAIAGTIFDYDLVSHCTPQQAMLEWPESESFYGGFSVYPSPTEGEINIQHSFEDIKSMRVYNMLGEVLHAFESPQYTINLNGEVPGIYFIELVNQNNERHVQKVILQ